MKQPIRLTWIVWLTVSLLQSALAAEVGARAPDFRLQGSDGRMHAMSDYRGRHVVLAFFPKAFTHG